MPAESGRFAGRIAVLTGASRGIGLATAQRLASEGARVVITARRRDDVDAALATLPEGSLGFTGNAADAAHRDDVLDRVADAFGQVDVLANLTGTNPAFGTLLDFAPDAAQKALAVNLLAPLAWTQALCAHERLRFAERGGAIVNLSSVTAETPSAGIGFYGVTKAAVNQLTRTLAVELGPRIRVNAVAPAVVRTGFSRALYEEREDEVAAHYPLGRLGEPADIAAAIAFLASDDAAWITGQVLTLDGGLITAGGSA